MKPLKAGAASAAPRPGPMRLIGQAMRLGVRVLVVATGLSLLLSLMFGSHLGLTWVYTLFITLGCWGAIHGGLKLAMRVAGEARPGWPPLPWTIVIIVLGTVLGYTAGNTMGNWVLGLQNPSLLAGLSRQTLVPILFALLPGAGFTWYFYTRERVAASEAQAQTAERQAAENQLRLLQSQLEPHMLFNTLANLRVLITLDPPRAQAMLDRLIAFLRATLTASRQSLHPLSDEFARVDDYLALMAVRMGTRLQVHLDLPSELAALPVPPLLLQPLVENSIRHGLEPQVAGGRISVQARREGQRLVLRVRDTGVGLQATDVGGTRFGLAQVRARLQTLYGSDASLQIGPVPDDDADGGTLATITLPWPTTATPNP